MTVMQQCCCPFSWQDHQLVTKLNGWIFRIEVATCMISYCTILILCCKCCPNLVLYQHKCEFIGYWVMSIDFEQYRWMLIEQCISLPSNDSWRISEAM